uniref:Uncharacterized protein n=1 Tax=Anguilla anguilla TaxID=7936 RepID=A0A0E9VXW9_ANGAN
MFCSKARPRTLSFSVWFYI